MRLNNLSWWVAWCWVGWACAERPTDTFYGRLIYDDLPPEASGPALDDFGLAHAFVLAAGYADGDLYEYLDLGPVNLTVPKAYVPTRGGVAVAGQYPIIDTLPGAEDYSPFWQVVTVEVPSDYEANDLKSLEGLKEANFAQTDTSEALHCAVLNPDAAWIDSSQTTQLTVFWGTGEVIPNPSYNTDPDAGPVDARVTLTDSDAQPGDVVLVPIWHKRLLGFCYSDNFSARYALAGTDLAGSALGARYDQYEILPADDDPGAPWPDVVPIFESATGQPARTQFAALTATGDQVLDADDLDTDATEALEIVDNPIVRAVE